MGQSIVFFFFNRTQIVLGGLAVLSTSSQVRKDPVLFKLPEYCQTELKDLKYLEIITDTIWTETTSTWRTVTLFDVELGCI